MLKIVIWHFFLSLENSLRLSHLERKKKEKKISPRRASIASLNSSEISSLWASNKSRIRSTLSANHLRISTKSYPRSNLCFSPLKIPGVSNIEMDFKTSELVFEHWNRLRKAFPNLVKGWNCLVGSTTKAQTVLFPSNVLAHDRNVVLLFSMFNFASILSKFLWSPKKCHQIFSQKQFYFTRFIQMF